VRPLLSLTTFDRTTKADASFAALVTALHGRAHQLVGRPLDLP